jgi:hypothetical protein
MARAVGAHRANSARGKLRRRGIPAVLLAVPLGLATVPPSLGWGYSAHRIVTGAAVDAVPGSLGGFLRAHRDALVELSLAPDTVAKEQDPEEKPRHFIDLDKYVGDPSRPGGMPGDLTGARGRYGAKALATQGELPWWIGECAVRLRAAMGSRNGAAVEREAGYLAHYVADLHQPLHLTSNFDGQQTGNDGIHFAYERFMIERRPAEYRKLRASMEPCPAPDMAARWAIERAGEIWPGIERILAADREATHAMRREGADYYAELGARLGGEARGEMARAAGAVAGLWVSAWEAAGRPDPARWTGGKTGVSRGGGKAGAKK